MTPAEFDAALDFLVAAVLEDDVDSALGVYDILSESYRAAAWEGSRLRAQVRRSRLEAEHLVDAMRAQTAAKS